MSPIPVYDGKRKSWVKSVRQRIPDKRRHHADLQESFVGLESWEPLSTAVRRPSFLSHSASTPVPRVTFVPVLLKI